MTLKCNQCSLLHIVNEGLFGGVLRVALAESHFLNELGYISRVILLFNLPIPNDVLTKYSKANIMYIRRNIIPRCIQGYANPILRELLGKYLMKMKLTNNVDYILLHNLSALPLARYIKHVTGAKIALYIHNPTSPPSLTKLFARCSKLARVNYVYSLEDIDVVITSSERMRRYIRDVFGVDAHIIPPGCEPTHEPTANKLSYVLVPQRISIGKRVHIVARLLTTCSARFCTVFAGSFHYTTAKTIKLIRKSGIRHYVIVLNPSDRTLTWLYRRALCSVSIIDEPFGMHIIEAASQGTAVVAPRNAGASELFMHGVHGFFFEHEEKLPEYIDKLVSNPELAIKMGYEAWKICKEKYTWYHHVRKLVQILGKV